MLLAETMASTPEMAALFSAEATIQSMLDVESALAQAGAAAGLIPHNAARAIAATCVSARFDTATLARDGALAGTIVIPLVKWLKHQLPDFAGHVHLGGTSQDIIDNALILQLRGGIALLLTSLHNMAAAAAALTRTYARTPMLARTLLQPAMPSTFGLKTAAWLCAINDSRRALAQSSREALVLQCGGAAGTLDALGDQAPIFLSTFGAALKLPVPVMHWQTRRAPLGRLAATIACATAAAGKIATDIALLMQGEIAELSEPAAPGRGGSSAMAHKRNPTLSIAAKAAALRAPAYAATLLSTQMSEHERAAGAWQAEAVTWPPLMLSASGALAAMAEALAGLEVDAGRMTANLALLPPTGLPPAIGWMIARALDAHEDFDK